MSKSDEELVGGSADIEKNGELRAGSLGSFRQGEDGQQQLHVILS
jgi:hypothetical protein